MFSLDRPSTGWVEVAVGQGHVCGRRAGELYCWGSNAAGEVGVGDELSTIDAPAKVTGTWKQLSASYIHTCAIANDHTLSCWGANSSGQLGVGSTTNTRIPKALPGAWERVDASFFGTCAIDRDGQLWCWGPNKAGQLGDGTTTNRTEPSRVGDARWVDVGRGWLHACGIQADNTLWCWGDQPPDPEPPISDPALATPSIVPVQLGTETWRSVSALFTATCGITTTGHLRCWGTNAARQLGIGEVPRADEPTAVLADGEDHDDWVQLDAGALAACAVRANGEAWCWGQNERGLLASDDVVIATPRRVEHPDGGDWKVVSVGIANACFVDGRERAWCVGANGFSQLADGGTSPRVPTPPSPDLPADRASAGGQVSCTIRNTELACGGKGGAYQLGNGASIAARSLATVAGTWTAATIGYEHACGIQTGGVVACWGNDRGESAGNGPGITVAPVPAPVSSARTFMSIDAGGFFTCGVDSARAIACWGDNFNGQLGNNSTTNSGVPVDITTVMPVPVWSSVSAGASHACAIQNNGVVRCWGDNAFGQLGNGTTDESRTVTTRLLSGGGTLPAFAKVSAGLDHSCAIGADDTLWCWGNNARGQLGIDLGFLVSIPSAKVHPETWLDVAAGNGFTCAIRTDSTLWCWGTNSRGQLGDGSLLDRRAPVQVAGTGWTSVVAGIDHACAQRGTDVRCWGNNDDGATVTGDAWTTELQEIVEPAPLAP